MQESMWRGYLGVLRGEEARGDAEGGVPRVLGALQLQHYDVLASLRPHLEKSPVVHQLCSLHSEPHVPFKKIIIKYMLIWRYNVENTREIKKN